MGRLRPPERALRRSPGRGRPAGLYLEAGRLLFECRRPHQVCPRSPAREAPRSPSPRESPAEGARSAPEDDAPYVREGDAASPEPGAFPTRKGKGSQAPSVDDEGMAYL